MISDKLRNYDAAAHRHGTDSGALPLNVTSLPDFRATANTQPDSDEDIACLTGEPEAEDRLPSDSDVDAGGNQSFRRRWAKYSQNEISSF